MKSSAIDTRLITVAAWNNHHDWPSQHALRHLIFNMEKNGFKTAFKRVGRRVLIDEKEFFNCVNAQNADGNISNGGAA
jgi:hypothetical protein